MPTDSYLIPALFLFTFVVAIAFGISQYNKAKKARAQHHQSAQAKAHGERLGERSNATKSTEEKTQRPYAPRP